MMTEFTKTKMHFALGMIGTLFALHPIVERYPDLGFDYQVLQWRVSLQLICLDDNSEALRTPVCALAISFAPAIAHARSRAASSSGSTPNSPPKPRKRPRPRRLSQAP